MVTLLYIITLGVLYLIARLIVGISKQSKIAWTRLHELQQKANEVETKDEVMKLMNSVNNFRAETYNSEVVPYIDVLYAYLCGLYRNSNIKFKNEQGIK
jgi:hypothetical protein